ncbi:MAG: S46 family peptidase [Candidatus Aminicenantes bacterium]|nr:MAG: S46 family peptidase [Candidatus Aminicenantes bacterium]
MKNMIGFFLLIILLTFLSHSLLPEEGMWPISEIHKLDLQSKGLEIDLKEIYNPEGLSLIYAVVNVGATGSFVSPDGLILTNHHVAYGSVQAASTKEKDYIKHGFLARDRSEEIPAKGRTARITESYRDVSKEVLSVVKKRMSFVERTKAIEKKMKEIVKKTEQKNPGKRAEVAEMFPGKTYVLFIFTFLRDLRLVYVPPRSIGEFGGDVDNWMWPRHTGDFSFMRAYVAPDGSPAEYSPKNVPFHPKKYLKIASGGANEEDFVFMLGYPGRTYRHRTSHYLAFEEEIRMPFVVDWYGWQISVMQKMGEKDRGVALKHLSRIKGLSNTMKNYQGKLTGLKRLQLTAKRQEEEKALREFIGKDKERKAKYGDILERVGKIYEQIREQAEYELVLDYIRRSVNMIYFGYTVYEAAVELQKDDLERESAYMERNFPQTKRRLELTLRNYYEPTDKMIMKEILMRAANLPQKHRIPAVDDIVKGGKPEEAIDGFIEKAYAETELDELGVLIDSMTKSSQKLKEMNDPFLKLAKALYPTYQKLKETQEARKGALDELYALLIDVKKQFLKKDFIPDANRTLRLTFGRIRGYDPADAVYYNPITTLDGVIEKTTGVEPFDTPQKIFDLYKAKDFGRFMHPELKSVPVCILYNMDTTGGNSGSPVLNGRGELVGINFDRAWEATINDYAWSEKYSRSIAVDIRYVLWVTQKYGGVDFLLKEMNVFK